MQSNLGEVVKLFLKLGVIGFGGPAAHIAMMRDEVVERRKWMSDQAFLDLVGATSLIPGPNSTEMTMHLGYLRAGWRGLVAGGVCFILPAAAITVTLAWLYQKYGTVDYVMPWLIGVRPVVLAVIVGAMFALLKKAVKNVTLGVLAGGAVAASLLGVQVLVVLLGVGLIGAVLLRLLAGNKDGDSDDGQKTAGIIGALAAVGGSSSSAKAAAGAVAGAATVGLATAVTLPKLFLFFLKVGAILYGSGYVLVAYLEEDLVRNWQWMEQSTLLDAVAIGQMTPGPVFTTSTAVGFLLRGLLGAVVASVGIFLPSFCFVAMSQPVVARIRQSAFAGAFLDAVNAAAVGLMIAVAWHLGVQTLVNWQTILICLLAFILATKWKVNVVWLLIGGAVLGRLGAILV